MLVLKIQTYQRFSILANIIFLITVLLSKFGETAETKRNDLPNFDSLDQDNFLSNLVSTALKTESQNQSNNIKTIKESKENFLYSALLGECEKYLNRPLIKFLVEQSNTDLFQRVIDSKEYKVFIAFIKTEGTDLNQRNKYGHTPLISAIIISDLSMVKELINRGAKINYDQHKFEDTPLYYALKDTTDLFILDFILKKGADLNILKQNFPILSRILNETVFWIYVRPNLLRQYGFDLSTQDSQGKTLLITAVEHGHFITAVILIDLEVNLNINDNQNNTALIFAIKQNNLDLVKELVEKNADLDVVDGLGKNVLSLAIENKNQEIIEFLNSKKNA